MAETRGNKFARDSDMLYMIGMYDSKEVTWNTVSVVDLDHMGSTTISRISARAVLSGSLHLLEMACTTGPNKIEWLPLTDCVMPYSIITPGLTEPSFHFDEVSKEWVIVSLGISDNRRVKKCTSYDVLGPWHCAYVTEISDEMWSGDNYFVYAAKAHPELRVRPQYNDKQSPLVISFATNVNKGPSELFGEAYFGAYIPKFLAIEKQTRPQLPRNRTSRIMRT
jgi:hypothetical protein